jgi:hypothetical protein
VVLNSIVLGFTALNDGVEWDAASTNNIAYIDGDPALEDPMLAFQGGAAFARPDTISSSDDPARYLPVTGSPAIDGGTCDGAPDHDYAGNARPRGTTCDIGAFEAAPPVVPLNPPTNLVATGGTKKVDLSWAAPAAGTTPTGYQVFRGATKIADVPATPTAYTDSDASLVPGTAYCYTVKSTADERTSDPSNESCGTPVAGTNWVRGDANGDTKIDISDPIANLTFQFLGGTVPCQGALDVDSSNAVDITDAIYLLSHLFLGGQAPAAPFPACDVFEGCGQYQSPLTCP